MPANISMNVKDAAQFCDLRPGTAVSSAHLGRSCAHRCK